MALMKGYPWNLTEWLSIFTLIFIDIYLTTSITQIYIMNCEIEMFQNSVLFTAQGNMLSNVQHRYSYVAIDKSRT